MEFSAKLITYSPSGTQTQLQVRMQDETVWLSQKQLTKLFQTTGSNVASHLSNIYRQGELCKSTTTKRFSIIQPEGKRQVKRQLRHYNLDAIISLGYRIDRHSVTGFRIWASQLLKEQSNSGGEINHTEVNSTHFSFDYFAELARRIEDIRSSERRCYQKISDIFTTSIDYSPTSKLSVEFFRTIQNKLYCGITGQTAAEILCQRADASLKNMGLTHWQQRAYGKAICQTDALVAKNYLTKKELLALNNLTLQYLAFAQGQALRHVPMTMDDWCKKLDGFLMLNDANLMEHKAKVTSESAKYHAKLEYAQFKRLLHVQTATTSAMDDSSRLQNIMH